MGEVKRTARRTAGAIAGLGIVGIAKATKDAAAFGKQIGEVGTLGAFGVGELDKVGDSVLDLAKDLGATTDELTGGLYQALSAGVGKEDVFNFLRTAVIAAKAGVTDTETAVDGLTSILNAYRKSSAEAGAVSDQLFATVKLGKTTFAELSASIGDVAPAAASVGVSTEELLGSFATLTKQGVQTDKAATGIKGVLTALIKPSSALSAKLKDLGVASGTAAVKQFGFQGALEKISTSVGNNNAELAKLFPNIRGLGAVFSLAGENAALAAADLDAVKNSAGATAGAFEIINSTGSASFDKLQANIQAASIKIGQETLPIITQELNTLTEALNTADGDRFLRDLGDTAAGALGVIKLLVNGVKELSELLKLPDLGKFLSGNIGVFRTTSDIIGSATTPEQIAAFKQIQSSGDLLKGGTSFQSIVQSQVIEDLLRGGSTESVLILQNIQKTLDGRLPNNVAGQVK
jgi:TP901 family phage tail tape measure protein